jgi:hypothetical protein
MTTVSRWAYPGNIVGLVGFPIAESKIDYGTPAIVALLENVTA